MQVILGILKPCSNCGREASDTDNFCPNCGKPFPAIVSVPKGTVGAGTQLSLPVADRAAISKFRLFALLSIFPFAYGVAFLFIGGPSYPASALGSLASLAVEAAAALFLRAGFRILSKVDQRSFGSPVTFTTIYVIALPIVLGFLQLFVGPLSRFVNLQQPPSQLLSSSELASILVFSVILFVGGVLLLVGAIAGVILGTWRLGVRYGKRLLKVAPILYVIPFIQLAATIIFVLTFERMRRIDATQPASKRPLTAGPEIRSTCP